VIDWLKTGDRNLKRSDSEGTVDRHSQCRENEWRQFQISLSNSQWLIVEINQYIEVKSHDCHLNSLQSSQNEGNETSMITNIQTMLLYHCQIMLFSLFDAKLFPSPDQRFDLSNYHEGNKPRDQDIMWAFTKHSEGQSFRSFKSIFARSSILTELVSHHLSAFHSCEIRLW
jgi:hypothetical protein